MRYACISNDMILFISNLSRISNYTFSLNIIRAFISDESMSRTVKSKVRTEN